MPGLIPMTAEELKLVQHNAEMLQDHEERLKFDNADYYISKDGAKFLPKKLTHISTYVPEPTEVVGLIETESKWRCIFVFEGGRYETQFFDTREEAEAALAGAAKE